jgi:hypothetical protein
VSSDLTNYPAKLKAKPSLFAPPSFPFSFPSVFIPSLLPTQKVFIKLYAGNWGYKDDETQSLLMR